MKPDLIVGEPDGGQCVRRLHIIALESAGIFRDQPVVRAGAVDLRPSAGKIPEGEKLRFISLQKFEIIRSIPEIVDRPVDFALLADLPVVFREGNIRIDGKFPGLWHVGSRDRGK